MFAGAIGIECELIPECHVQYGVCYKKRDMLSSYGACLQAIDHRTVVIGFCDGSVTQVVLPDSTGMF